jgi:hypothetical protein
MKERLIKNWKTTVIGLAVLLIGVIALFLGKITGYEFLGFVTTSFPLLVAKDSLITGLTMGSVTVASSDPPDPPGPGEGGGK